MYNQFVMHDVTYSEDSTTDFIDIAMPPDEDTFPLNTTFRVWRTESVPGTGTSKSNPRENINQATTWLDVSSLYGSTTTVSHALRSFKGGKLLTSDGDYLPFNTMKLPMRTRPGVPVESLFAGGDPRTNEDWLMLAVHTLLLRDHNRMCDLLVKQHPDYNDEQIYQTIRLAMGAKFALIANSYQMAYWQTSGADAMPWPRDDGRFSTMYLLL
jgi:peroxidase